MAAMFDAAEARENTALLACLSVLTEQQFGKAASSMAA